MRIVNQEYVRKELEFATLTDGQVFLIPGGTGRDAYMKLESLVFNDDGEYNCVLLNSGELYFMDSDQLVHLQESTLTIKHKVDDI